MVGKTQTEGRILTIAGTVVAIVNKFEILGTENIAPLRKEAAQIICKVGGEISEKSLCSERPLLCDFVSEFFTEMAYILKCLCIVAVFA